MRSIELFAVALLAAAPFSSDGAATTTTYAIGGTVSGLLAGSRVVVQNNGADDTTISVNGPFAFRAQVPGGSAYAVAVLTQPRNELCTVINGSGTANGNVSNVRVDCAPSLAGKEAGNGEGSGNAGALSLQRWSGTLKGRYQGGSYDYSAILPFSFVVDQNGVVKGKGHVKVTSSPHTYTIAPAGKNPAYDCTALDKWTPDEFDVDVVGRRDGNQFNLNVSHDLKTTLDHQGVACTDPRAPLTHSTSVKGSPVIYLGNNFYHPQVLAEDNATNSWHVTLPGVYINKIELTGGIEIHRAPQISTP
jgi:hypothetical protein